MANRHVPYNVKRNWDLKSIYGISLKQFNDLKEKQKNCCGICKTPEKKFSLDVDHDHQTKRVRGLLCRKCNIGLGQFNDSIEILYRAIEYLKSSRPVEKTK